MSSVGVDTCFAHEFCSVCDAPRASRYASVPGASMTIRWFCSSQVGEPHPACYAEWVAAGYPMVGPFDGSSS